jgi:hypothetical protein
MSFRFLCVCILLSSCSWLNTQPKSPPALNPPSLDLRCLAETPNLLSELFSGKPERSPALFLCLDRTLAAFATHTTGISPESYSTADIRAFANRYLPVSHTVSIGFAKSIFEMKQILIGGKSDQIQKSEIKTLRNRLSRMGSLLIPVAVHLPVLMRPASETAEARRNAAPALSAFLDGISELLSESPNPLPWQALANFLKQLEAFTEKDDRSILPFIIEQIPIFQNLKILLVGGEERVIEKHKWSPILRSISHFYGTLLMTRSPLELFEQLGLEIESTPAEQSRAATRLTGLLKTLILDSSLRSLPMIKVFSDGYGKALLFSAIVFPESKGSLALKPLLETPALRRLTARIVTEFARLRESADFARRIQMLADESATLFEQAALASDGSAPTLDLRAVLDFYDEIECMLDPSANPRQIRNALLVVQKAVPILIGRDPNSLTPKELRSFLQKTVDLIGLWKERPEKQETEILSVVVAVLNRAPRPTVITLLELQSLIEAARSWFHGFEWALLLRKMTEGLRLKSVILGGSVESLSGRELDQLAYLTQSFRREDSTGNTLLSLSNLLRNRGLRACSLRTLIESTEPLLNDRLRAWLLDSNGYPRLKWLSAWKRWSVGGDPDWILPSEFADFARLAGQVIESIPSGWKPGVNSETARAISRVLMVFRESARGGTPLRILHSLLRESLQLHSNRIRDDSIDRFLIGIHTRMLRGLKTPKPESLEGLIFNSTDWDPLIQISTRIASDLEFIEKIFSGRTVLPRRVLQEQLGGSELSPALIAPPLGTDPIQISAEESLQKASLYRLISLIFNRYDLTARGSLSSPGLNEESLHDLLTDINALAFDLELTWGESSARVSAPIRRKTIDLLTLRANGDGLVDPLEALEFLLLAQIGKNLLERSLAKLTPICFPGSPRVEIQGIPGDCLRTHFWKREFLEAIYFPEIPGFAQEIHRIDQDRFLNLLGDLWRSATTRLTNPTGMPPEGTVLVSRSDFESLVAVPLFLENLLVRFDSNQDGQLVFSEAMRALPIFCREIQTNAGPRIRGSCDPGGNPDQIEAIFGHLLYRQRPPRKIRSEDSLWRRLRATRELFSWFRQWNQLDRNPEVRDIAPPNLKRADLLRIISRLSEDRGPDD